MHTLLFGKTGNQFYYIIDGESYEDEGGLFPTTAVARIAANEKIKELLQDPKKQYDIYVTDLHELKDFALQFFGRHVKTSIRGNHLTIWLSTDTAFFNFAMEYQKSKL